MAIFRDGNKKVIVDTIKEYFAQEPFFYIKGRNGDPANMGYKSIFKQNGRVFTNAAGEQEFVLGQQGWDGHSTFLGFEAGKNEARINYDERTNGWEADYNTGIGYGVMKFITTGFSNVGVGHEAGLNITTGGSNTLIGQRTGMMLTTTNNNTFLGNQINAAGTGTLLADCTLIGRQIARSATVGNNTIIIGASNAAYFTLDIGTRNIALGAETMHSSTNVGDDNIFMGYRVNTGDNAGATNNIVMGYSAKSAWDSCFVVGRAAASTADNQFVVGSATYNIGAVTAEAITPDNTWTVKINGADYKIPLLAI